MAEGRTGVFFDPCTPEALAATVRAFDALAIDPAACVANAAQFAPASFKHGLEAVVEQALASKHERAARRQPRRRGRGLASAA